MLAARPVRLLVARLASSSSAFAPAPSPPSPSPVPAAARAMASWSRLIRFAADDGRETFGEPVVDGDKDFDARVAANDLWAVELTGAASPVGALTRGDKIHVKELRQLLRPADVPIIRCIGLNYMKHSEARVRPGPPRRPTCPLTPRPSPGGRSQAAPIPLRLHQAQHLPS